MDGDSGSAPKISRGEAEQIAEDGWRAYEAGRPVTVCPYPPKDPRQELWVRNYVAAQNTVGRGHRIEPGDATAAAMAELDAAEQPTPAAPPAVPAQA